MESLIKTGVVRNGMVLSAEHNYPGSETAEREIDSIMHEQFASLTVGDAATAVILDNHGSDIEALHMIEMTSCAESALLCLGMPSEETVGIALYTKNIKLHAASNLMIWPTMAKRVFGERNSSIPEENLIMSFPINWGPSSSEVS